MVFDYQLYRSARRKTLALQVKQGNIIVRAPVFLSKQQIDHFISAKSDWLKQKLETHSQIALDKLQFTQNSKIYYLGQEKVLDIQYQSKTDIKITDASIIVFISFRQQKNITTEQCLVKLVKQQLANFFKLAIEQYLAVKLPLLSEKSQLFPTKYKVRRYKSRWGSCNCRGELSFNYLLIMAPDWVIDYVIVHELCHLEQLNHSTKFWHLVAQYDRQYQQAITWLKDHQQKLHWQ